MTEAHDIRVGRLKLHHLEDLDIHYVKTWSKWWLKTVNEKGTQEKDKVVLKLSNSDGTRLNQCQSRKR